MYNKIFAKILDSSIWLEPTPTRIIWLTMLAAMDETGFCQFASVANLAHRAILPLTEAVAAISVLESPDENSSDPDNEGRRLEKVPGGWIVLNAVKYRELVTRSVIQEQTRRRVAAHRERQKSNAPVTHGNAKAHECNAPVTPSEADTDTDTIPDSSAPAKPGRASEVRRVKWSTDGWVGIEEQDRRAWIESFPACDIEMQLSRMDLWLRSNPAKARKSNFYRFIVNWLQRQQNQGGDIPSARNESARDFFS